MSGEDDYIAAEARFIRELDEFAERRKAEAWGHRLRELCSRIDKPKTFVMRHRARLIKNARVLKPTLSEEEATTWVDGVIGLETLD